MVSIKNKNTSIALHDLTGFAGRCDAILFSDNPNFIPDNTSEVLPKWRRELMGKSAEIIDEKPFDIVFIGGGYADREMQPKGRMGMSNMWTWENTDSEQTFPAVPWALDLSEAEFPYPRKFHAEWFWETGFDKDPIKDLEAIRDWNFRAAYGAFNALKNKDAYTRNDPDKKDHKNASLTWMAYIGGPRETQQLLGDIILTEDDLVNKKPFPDGCVLTTWGIDLHYPQERYMKKYAHNPFISRAEFGEGVDKHRGYPVPYRCFYSRNINNLFMAGRNVSVTHKALGTVRVMKTGGHDGR